MKVKELKQRLHVYNFKLRHSYHHSWIIYIEKPYSNESHLSREIDCAEISSRYPGYFIKKPKYLSISVLTLINRFASTPLEDRSDYYAPRHFFVVCSRMSGYRIQVWYLNSRRKIASRIGYHVQQFINPHYYLTRAQVIKMESYLLKHGIVKESLTILPVVKEQ